MLEALPRRRSLIAWGVAASLAVSLVPVSIMYFREKPPPSEPLRLLATTPEGLLPILSPDGRKAAYMMGGRLWIQFLASGESRDLTAADGPCALLVPRQIVSSAIYSKENSRRSRRLAVLQLNCDGVAGLIFCLQVARGIGEDVIVFGDRSLGLFRVPASGGSPLQITALNSARHENSQYCPSFLPDGRHFVYMGASTDQWKSALYLGSVDATPEQQSSTPLLLANSQPVYTPSSTPGTGYLLFVREGSLLAQPFDNRRMEPKRAALQAVVQDLSFSFPGTSSEPFSASANGTLVFGRRARSNSAAHLVRPRGQK